MLIPTNKKNFGIDTYKTKNIELINFLNDNDILPINYYDGTAEFINCKTLREMIKRFRGGQVKNE